MIRRLIFKLMKIVEEAIDSSHEAKRKMLKLLLFSNLDQAKIVSAVEATNHVTYLKDYDLLQ